MRHKVVAALLASTLGLLYLPARPAASRGVTRHSRRLAKGVRLTVIKDPSGPHRIRVISVRLSAPSSVEVALSNNALPGLERTSAMARRRRAIAAINGDYARPSGRPVYGFAESGWLAQSPLGWGRNFALDYAGRTPYVGHGRLSILLRDPAGGESITIQRFNQGGPRWAQVAAFTGAGGALEKPPRRACSVRLYPRSRARPDSSGAVQVTVEVDVVRCSATPLARRGGVVLAADRYGPRARELASLRVGSRLVLSWSMGWPGVFDAIGGNPTLVERGRVVVPRGSSPFFRRHPRSGVGTTADGRILLVTVDGRQPGYSVGMKLRSFARLFVSLGARWALNLDGGGSSTMVVRGKVVNRPSDGSQRPVSSAILVLRRPSSTSHLSPSRTPLELGVSSATRQAIVTDPASTGGLASSLAEIGALPRALRASARAFQRR